jgi:hypothetical protein
MQCGKWDISGSRQQRRCNLDCGDLPAFLEALRIAVVTRVAEAEVVGVGQVYWMARWSQCAPGAEVAPAGDVAHIAGSKERLKTNVRPAYLDG